MALYGVRLVINLFDLCIYRRYLEEFIGNRKTSMEFSVLLLVVCELIGSAVNQMGISWLNFMTMVAILCVYVCQYEAGIVSRLIAVLLYGTFESNNCGGVLQTEIWKKHSTISNAKRNAIYVDNDTFMQPDQLLFTDRGCKRINLGTDGRAVHVHHLCHYHH